MINIIGAVVAGIVGTIVMTLVRTIQRQRILKEDKNDKCTAYRRDSHSY